MLASQVDGLRADVAGYDVGLRRTTGDIARNRHSYMLPGAATDPHGERSYGERPCVVRLGKHQRRAPSALPRASGSIPAIRVRNRWLVPRAALLRLLGEEDDE